MSNFRQTPQPAEGWLARYSDIIWKYGTAILDVSQLPLPKDQMKVALSAKWRRAADETKRGAIEVGFMHLAHFQEGVGENPIKRNLPEGADPAKFKASLFADPEKLAAFVEPWLKLEVEKSQLRRELDELRRELDELKERELCRKEVQSAKIAGAWFTGCLVALLVSGPAVKGFALLGASVSGWLLVFNGATAISRRLDGERRRWFNVAIAIVFPTLLSLFFLKDAQTITFGNTFGHLLSPWLLLPLGITALFSWAAADQLDREHPFRGFLIAATVLWALSVSGYEGVRFGSDNDAYYSDDVGYDPAVKTTGQFFGRFLVYVGLSYAVMLARLRLERERRERNAR